MRSSQTRARTRVPCIGRRILNHCATREALCSYLFYCIVKAGVQINPNICFEERWYPVSFTGRVPTRTAEVPAGQVGFQLVPCWPVMMQDPGVGSWRRVAARLHPQGLPGLLCLWDVPAADLVVFSSSAWRQRSQLLKAGSCLSNDNSHVQRMALLLVSFPWRWLYFWPFLSACLTWPGTLESESEPSKMFREALPQWTFPEWNNTLEKPPSSPSFRLSGLPSGASPSDSSNVPWGRLPLLLFEAVQASWLTGIQ